MSAQVIEPLTTGVSATPADDVDQKINANPAEITRWKNGDMISKELDRQQKKDPKSRVFVVSGDIYFARPNFARPQWIVRIDRGEWINSPDDPSNIISIMLGNLRTQINSSDYNDVRTPCSTSSITLYDNARNQRYRGELSIQVYGYSPWNESYCCSGLINVAGTMYPLFGVSKKTGSNDQHVKHANFETFKTLVDAYIRKIWTYYVTNQNPIDIVP